MTELTHEEKVHVLATAMRGALDRRSRFYSSRVSDGELVMIAEEVITKFEEAEQ